MPISRARKMANSRNIYAGTVASGDWSGSGPYTQVISMPGMSSADVIVIGSIIKKLL